jgi:hypothetical protein
MSEDGKRTAAMGVLGGSAPNFQNPALAKREELRQAKTCAPQAVRIPRR